MRTREDILKRIQATNSAFMNADAATKRVMLAHDVLHRIEVQQFIPVYGIGGILAAYNIINVSENIQSHEQVFHARYMEHNKTGSIKEFLDENPSSMCKICAKGATFMAYIGRVNNLDWDDLSADTSHDSPSLSMLLEIYSEKQLAMMEYFYEGISHVDFNLNGNPFYTSEERRAIETYRKEVLEAVDYMAPSRTIAHTLMRAMCENIIENKGMFIVNGVDPEAVYEAPKPLTEEEL